MDRTELIAKLQALLGGDPEGGHADADSLLLEYINDREIEAAYRAIEKWYG